MEKLLDGWAETIRVALEDTEEKNGIRLDSLGHKLVTRLLPEYLAELGQAEAKKAEIEARLDEGRRRWRSGCASLNRTLDIAERIIGVACERLRVQIAGGQER